MSGRDEYGYYDPNSNMEATKLYRYLASSTYSAGSPFIDDYSTSVPAVNGPTGLLGLAAGMLFKRYLGTEEPFSFRNPYERPAGDLGAYGLSRFPGNVERMNTAMTLARNARAAAVGTMLRGGTFLSAVSESALGEHTADSLRKNLDEWVRSPDKLPAYATQALQGFFGVPDFGDAATQAAKHAEALISTGYLDSGAARRDYAGQGIDSSKWRDARNKVVTNFFNAAMSNMFRADKDGNLSFVRNEDFMRGFDVKTVTSILEQVAASSGNIGDSNTEVLRERLKTVGGAAIKTLEAFRDLFGDAEKARQVLGRITGGNLGNLTPDDFEKITHRTRGLMNLGQTAGISAEAVAGMYNITAMGTRSALGFSASDISGGYAPEGVVNAVTQNFLGQELSNYGVSDVSKLDPTIQQRVKSRALWRSTQFASSSTAKSMAAFLYARDRGLINDASAARLKGMLESGNRETQSQAMNMVARSLGMTSEDLMDPMKYKLFTNYINQHGLSTEFADMGITAANKEDRFVYKSAVANEGLNMATEAATAVGFTGVDEAASARRAGNIISKLKDIAKNDKTAGAVLNMVNAAMRDGGADAAISKFEDLKGKLGDLGETISIDAVADAANALNAKTYGDISSDLTHFGWNDRFRANGAGEKISRVDAAKVFNNLADYYEGIGRGKEAEVIRSKVESGDFKGLASILGDRVYNDEEAMAFAFSDVTFGEGPEKVRGATPTLDKSYVDALVSKDVKEKHRHYIEDIYDSKIFNGLSSEQRVNIDLEYIVGRATGNYKKFNELLESNGLSDFKIEGEAAKVFQDNLTAEQKKEIEAWGKGRGENGGDRSVESVMNSVVFGLLTDEEKTSLAAALAPLEEGKNRDESTAALAGLADLGDMFGEEMVSIDKFSDSVKDLGDRADATSAKLEEIGKRVQDTVDSFEDKNSTVIQALAGVLSENTDEGVKNAGERLGNALLNQGLSAEGKGEVLSGLSSLFENLFGSINISQLVDNFAETVGKKIAEAINNDSNNAPSGSAD